VHARKIRTIALAPQLLLDTHVVIRWVAEPKKLSQDQIRVLRTAVGRGEPLALSAITLLEVAALSVKGGNQLRVNPRELLDTIGASADFQIVPLDIEIATEIAVLGDALRDPGDRTIVATARVHGLRLVTSDQRIIESKLVPVID
jgi:PIN domain nuclease of toxin-antitoxin system